jgi:hypothetical protein
MNARASENYLAISRSKFNKVIFLAIFYISIKALISGLYFYAA